MSKKPVVARLEQEMLSVLSEPDQTKRSQKLKQTINAPVFIEAVLASAGTEMIFKFTANNAESENPAPQHLLFIPDLGDQHANDLIAKMAAIGESNMEETVKLGWLPDNNQFGRYQDFEIMKMLQDNVILRLLILANSGNTFEEIETRRINSTGLTSDDEWVDVDEE